MNKVVYHPLPSRLVRDVPQMNVSDEEAIALKNFIADGSGTLKTRTAYTSGTSNALSGFTGGNRPEYPPVATFQVEDKVGWTFLDGTSVAENLEMVYFDGGITQWDGTTLANQGTYRTMVFDEQTSTATNGLTFTAFGPTVSYERNVIGVSPTALTYYARHHGSATFPATRLRAWSGHTEDTDDTGSDATVTNGSTTVTFSSTTPQSDWIGRYFTSNQTAGSVSGGNGSPYQFPYRIVAITGTTCTLERPYGMGQNTTNVPNLSGAAWRVANRFIPIGSPPWPGCTEVFRERVFTGRGTLATAVGPWYGHYNTLLSWSSPGNPWLWPEENFTVVDEDYDDPIMALMTAGDHLVICKRRRTYIMGGRDESTFNVEMLSDRVGCVSALATAKFDNSAAWLGTDGRLWVYSPAGGLQSLSDPSGRGVKLRTFGTGAYAHTVGRTANALVLTDMGGTFPQYCEMLDNATYERSNVSLDDSETFVFNLDNGAVWEYGPYLSGVVTHSKSGKHFAVVEGSTTRDVVQVFTTTPEWPNGSLPQAHEYKATMVLQSPFSPGTQSKLNKLYLYYLRPVSQSVDQTDENTFKYTVSGTTTSLTGNVATSVSFDDPAIEDDFVASEEQTTTVVEIVGTVLGPEVTLTIENQDSSPFYGAMTLVAVEGHWESTARPGTPQSNSVTVT